jgi:hypothetical protein
MSPLSVKGDKIYAYARRLEPLSREGSLLGLDFSSLIATDVTIAGEGLQNLGLCSVVSAFKQRGIFIVPHLL